MTALTLQKLKEVMGERRGSGKLFSGLSFVVIYLNANLSAKKKGTVKNVINIQQARRVCECEAAVTGRVSRTETWPGKAALPRRGC